MMKNRAIYDIAHCYQNGDLESALMEAAAWVKELGEERIVHIIARLDENIPGAWWVDVIYRAKQP